MSAYDEVYAFISAEYFDETSMEIKIASGDREKRK